MRSTEWPRNQERTRAGRNHSQAGARRLPVLWKHQTIGKTKNMWVK